MTISPALNGFIKGIIVTVFAAAVGYISDPGHLTFFSGSVATIIAALASSVESYIKAKTGNGLFGAVRVAE